MLEAAVFFLTAVFGGLGGWLLLYGTVSMISERGYDEGMSISAGILLEGVVFIIIAAAIYLCSHDLSILEIL